MPFWTRRAPEPGPSKGPALHPISLRPDTPKVPQTLLLADDSATIQRVIELTFADEDIKVIAVSDGDEAIGRIEAQPPDIVLVDIGMPGKTGYEVAHHIKQSPQLQHIPVLLLAGAFEPVDQAKAKAAGCDGVLAKPFEPQLVITRVNELLGRTGREAPATAAEKPVEQAPVSDLWGVPAMPAAAGHVSNLSSQAPGAADPVRPPQVAHLDQYFAELDAAFATLGSGPAEPAKTEQLPSTVADDWFHMSSNAPAAPPPDLWPSTEERAAQVEFVPQPESDPLELSRPYKTDLETVSVLQALIEPAPSPAPVTPPHVPVPEVQREPVALPPLADAFAAILAAEQHEPVSALTDLWPASPAAPPAASANGGLALGDEAMEAITRRVLDRLSDQVVRETVADLVSDVAERLVREEIERIKSTIK